MQYCNDFFEWPNWIEIQGHPIYLYQMTVQMNLSISNKLQVWSSPGLKGLEELPMAKSNPATQCLKWINRKSPTMAIILKLSIKSDILRSDASKSRGSYNVRYNGQQVYVPYSILYTFSSFSSSSHSSAMMLFFSGLF